MYRICENGIFKSIQGEGKMAGKSAVFIRFFGCNKQPKCSFCDENEKGFTIYKTEEILERLKELLPFSMVVFTGGEPTMQDHLAELADALHKEKYYVAIETNGILPIPGNIDWVTCSPKEDKINALIKEVGEFKFLVDDTPEEELLQKIRKIVQNAAYEEISLQALSNEKRLIEKALKIIEKNPEFRLSVQLHKFIGVM